MRFSLLAPLTRDFVNSSNMSDAGLRIVAATAKEVVEVESEKD